ncbi:MAG: acylphosphatase [Desulfobacterales bacterium]|jgi:acylphosphatase
MKDKTRAHAIISGRVQGVFFRMETMRAARRIGVFGWVRNLRDGNVEAVFEGDKTRIDAILDWCKEGPPHAHVTDVKVDWQEYTGEFESFVITY